MEVLKVGDNQKEANMSLWIAFRDNRKRKEEFTRQDIYDKYA